MLHKAVFKFPGELFCLIEPGILIDVFQIVVRYFVNLSGVEVANDPVSGVKLFDYFDFFV